jgi:hypothetical protein
LNIAKNDLGESAVATGTIDHIQFYSAAATTTLLKTADFLNILQVQAPRSLVRAFDPLFMYGIVGGSPSAFLIIKLDSFENAFPGMLAWEQTLEADIGGLFVTRDAAQNLPADTSFIDTAIKNKDVRILRDEAGNTILLYSFYSNNLLIITDSIYTLDNIESRLTSESLAR